MNYRHLKVTLLLVMSLLANWTLQSSRTTAWASSLGQDTPAQTVDAAAAAQAAAVIPTTFNYQGYVRNPDGTLATGQYTIVAKLWNVSDGGTEQNNLLHREEFPNITVRDGLFNIVLGDKTPFPAGLFQNNASLFLGITLDGVNELIPRQRLHAVPWALTASSLTPNATVNGLTNSGETLLNGLTNTGPTTLSSLSATGPVMLTADVTVNAIRRVGHKDDLLWDDSTYPMSLRRYTVEAPDNGAAFNSVPVDDTILQQLCADEDGCTLDLGMRSWWGAAAPGETLLAMSGTMRFSLSNNSANNQRRWRSEGFQGNDHTRSVLEAKDGDGVSASPLVYGDCNMTDGFFINGQDNRDPTLSFSLLNTHGSHQSPTMVCVLIIND